MGYNTKNYTEQGGEVTHIGGKLIIEEGGSIEGLPQATNVPAGSTVDELIVALKEAGYVKKDEFVPGCNLIPNPTDEELVTNHSKVDSVNYVDNEIEVVVPVNDLIAYPSSNPEQGTHKWLGLEIKTGLNSIVGTKFNDYELVEADATEATSVGCVAGSFVLYIKAEDIVVTPRVFTLSKPGYKTETITIKVTDTSN